MFSGAGGALARRRQDSSASPCYFRNLSFNYVFCFLFILSFNPSCPDFANLHRVLFPLFDAVTFRAPPATHFHALLRPCGSKTAHNEAFAQTCAQLFKSEIYRSTCHRSTISNLFSVSNRRNLAISPTTNLIPALESLSRVSSPVPLSPATILSTPILYSSVHSRHASIAYPSVNLGFHFLGLFSICGPTPLTIQSRPTCLISLARKLKGPRIFPYLSRFDQNSPLPFLSHTLCRFMESINRGRLLEHNSPLLLVWYKVVVGTLPLKSPRDIIYETNRLKKNGIMIPSPRSGDYRSFFNMFSPFPLNTDSKHVHIINIKGIIHVIESLKKNGIMIPSPRSGGYRSFPSFLSPIPPDLRTVNTHLLADEQFQLALLAPARTSDMEPSLTSPRLLTVTNLSSIDSFVEDHSTSRDLTCAIMLFSFCLKALMESMSFHLIYLFMALGNVSLIYVLNFVIFESPLFVLGLI